MGNGAWSVERGAWSVVNGSGIGAKGKKVWVIKTLFSVLPGGW
jgi:hypothetical protein